MDNAIVGLRRKVEVDPKRPQVIVAVHGEGYQLVQNPQNVAKVGLVPIPGGMLDLEGGSVTLDGQRTSLTTHERSLLELLIPLGGGLVSREDACQRIWRRQTRAIDHTVRRLRKKLERDPQNPRVLETVRGQGYRFVADTPLGRPTIPQADLIGRDADLQQVLNLMAGHRLVSILGPGGIGKTQLALAVAASLEGQGHQVVRCEAANAVTADTFLTALAGAADTNSGTLDHRIQAIISTPQVVLLLDNLEQVVDPGASPARGLAAGHQGPGPLYQSDADRFA